MGKTFLLAGGLLAVWFVIYFAFIRPGLPDTGEGLLIGMMINFAMGWILGTVAGLVAAARDWW